MGVAVQHSLSKLQPDDIRALVAYLHSVPPVATPNAAGAAHVAPVVDVAAIEPQHPSDLATLANASSVNGAQLYESACAACHAASGAGSPDGKHPDLASNSAVLQASPDNLIMTIADGVHRTVEGKAYAMPGFSADLNNAQIGAVATYVRQQIGGFSTPVITAEQVARVRNGDIRQTFLTRYAGHLIIVAVILLLIVIGLLGWRLTRRRHLAH
jgi:mono/diheme cytochrome c family protein